MRLYGQIFEAWTVQRIRTAIAADEALTRSKLSHQVCEWLDWRSPSGAFREMTCLKGPLKLEALGKIRLPASQGLPGKRRDGPSTSNSPFVVIGFAGTLAELDQERTNTRKTLSIEEKESYRWLQKLSAGQRNTITVLRYSPDQYW